MVSVVVSQTLPGILFTIVLIVFRGVEWTFLFTCHSYPEVISNLIKYFVF